MAHKKTFAIVFVAFFSLFVIFSNSPVYADSGDLVIAENMANLLNETTSTAASTANFGLDESISNAIDFVKNIIETRLGVDLQSVNPSTVISNFANILGNPHT